MESFTAGDYGGSAGITQYLRHAIVARMPTAETRGRRTPALVFTLLALLAAATLLLRTWGLEYDTVHPDDPKQIFAARKFVEGDYLYGLDSRDLYVRGYPFFAMHLVEWSYRGCEQVLRHVAPGVSPPREALPAEEFKGVLRRIGLALNCLYELAALGLVFVVGRRLFDPWAGLAAAAIFTVSSLHIQTAHIIGADLPGGLFVLGVFFFAVRLRERERLRDWLGAGVCAGLAAAAKYSGLLSLLAPALVFLELRLREGWRSPLSLRRCAGPLVVFAGFVATFLLATPSLLLAPKDGVAAIQSVLQAAKDFHVSEEYEGRRLAFVASIWYHHVNGFNRFFEPLPGWLTLVSIGVFVVRRRLRESFLWVYPLVLFPVAAYGFPVGVAYHYLGVLTPLVWVVGFAVVEGIRALRKPWLRVAAAALLAGWALVAATSDASVFSLPAASTLTERWFADCAQPERFDLESPRNARKQIYPRVLGVDFEDFFASARAEREQEAAGMVSLAARFDLEKRTPTLNHIRNRPHRIHWRDGKARDIELFPPPRRVGESRGELLFPTNLTLGRSSALVALTPEEPAVRHVRREGGASSWLLYAHYPARAAGRGRARLRIGFPGGRRVVRVAKGQDVLLDLDLGRADLLYNGLFSSVRLRSNEPLFVWLVSPQERGWFLLMMERWRELEAWEKGRPGWKSGARLAVARRHLGAGPVQGDAGATETAIPGFRTGDPAELYKAWTGGVDLGVYAEPRPGFPLERFFVKTPDDVLEPPELPPGSRLGGPYEQLVPGFYRVTWEVEGSGGTGVLEYRVTGDSGQREVAALTSPLPAGRKEVSMPLRITASSPGWDIEFPVVNKGDAPVRLVDVRLESDPELQLRWWLGELALALGDRAGGGGAALARP